MKGYRIIALMAAATVALTGCTYGYESDRQSSAESAQEEAGALAELNSHIKQMLELTEEPGNDEKIKEYIAYLLDAHNELYEKEEMARMNYNLDITDKAAEKAADEAGSDYYAADDALYYAFSHGYNTDYSELFEDLIDPDYLKYYGSSRLSLEKCEKAARESFEEFDELQDEYFDAVYSEDDDIEELRLQCAQIYLDNLCGIEPERFYGSYDRDYTPEDIIALSDIVYKNMEPVYEAFADTLVNIPDYISVYDAPEEKYDPFDIIAEYAPLISESVGNSAKRIRDEKLYTITESDKAVDEGYTIDLPKNDKAWIYNHSDASFMLESCIHEFGHFHSFLLDDSDMFNSTNNTDISEIQSQEMEILFLQFYDDIYGDNADARKICKILNLIDSVIVGFAVGEFEARVYNDRNDLSPEDVIEIFNDTVGAVDPDYELCYIGHLFTQPGYYVSYGVSALAAFSIFDDAVNDPETAAATYEKIAGISPKTGEYSFRSALEYCGIEDVLTESYVKKLAFELSKYCSKL